METIRGPPQKSQSAAVPVRSDGWSSFFPDRPTVSRLGEEISINRDVSGRSRGYPASSGRITARRGAWDRYRRCRGRARGGPRCLGNWPIAGPEPRSGLRDERSSRVERGGNLEDPFPAQEVVVEYSVTSRAWGHWRIALLPLRHRTPLGLRDRTQAGQPVALRRFTIIPHRADGTQIVGVHHNSKGNPRFLAAAGEHVLGSRCPSGIVEVGWDRVLCRSQRGGLRVLFFRPERSQI